jgi:hypothetical protein
MRVPSVEPPESDLHFVWIQFTRVRQLIPDFATFAPSPSK